MARDLTSGMVSEFTAVSLEPIILIKAEFPSADVNIWSGTRDLTFNADTYTGLGDLIGMSPIEETEDLKASGMRFSLSGIPSSMVATALSEHYQDRPITCWLGCLDSAGAIITDPVIMFKGRMDVMEIVDGGDTASIGIAAENVLIAMERASLRRYTPEDQKEVYSGDEGFAFVTSIQDKEIVWGLT